MITSVAMPKLGLTMEKGKIVKWRCQVGDRISKGQVIFEVETDKSVVEVESSSEGYVLQLLYEECDEVPIGTTILYLGESMEETVPKVEKDGGKPVEGNPDTSIEPMGNSAQLCTEKLSDDDANTRVKASPLARKLAKEHNIPLENISGTGPNGRIVKRDVMAWMAWNENAKFSLKNNEAEKQGTSTTLDVPNTWENSAERLETLSKMRKAIAERMTYSYCNIPQFMISKEVDVNKAQAYIQMMREQARIEGKPLPSLTDLITLAVAKSLRKYEILNATTRVEQGSMEIVYHNEVNIGLAIATDDGLIVPVIKEADKKSLFTLAEIRNGLREKAVEGRLSLSEFQGGTFTISNLGPFGVDFFQAIINPPEAAILAVGGINRKPVVRNEGITIRAMMNLCLTVDHRIIDGAIAAKFMQSVVRLLENDLFAL